MYSESARKGGFLRLRRRILIKRSNKKMKKMIYLLLFSCLIVSNATGCSKKTGSEFTKISVVEASTSSSTENSCETLRQSQQELYQDVYVTLLNPYIKKAIDDYYEPLLTTSPMYSPESVEILNLERPMGYRSFLFIIELQIEPYVGPHDSIGVDQLTIRVGAGENEVKVEKFEHIKSYELPPNLQELIKKGN